jgi:hypothetical protein
MKFDDNNFILETKNASNVWLEFEGKIVQIAGTAASLVVTRNCIIIKNAYKVYVEFRNSRGNTDRLIQAEYAEHVLITNEFVTLRNGFKIYVECGRWDVERHKHVKSVKLWKNRELNYLSKNTYASDKIRVREQRKRRYNMPDLDSELPYKRREEEAKKYNVELREKLDRELDDYMNC